MHLFLFSSHETRKQLKKQQKKNPKTNSSGIQLKWELTSQDVCPWLAHADRGRLPLTNKEKKNTKHLCRRLVAQRRVQHIFLPRTRTQFVNQYWILPRKCQKKSSLRLFCSAGKNRLFFFQKKSFLFLTLSINTPSDLFFLNVKPRTCQSQY